MSVRVLGSAVLRHGTRLLRTVYNNNEVMSVKSFGTGANRILRRGIHSGGCGATFINPSVGARIKGGPGSRRPTHILRHVGTQLSIHARRILIDNVLNRVGGNLAAELTIKAAQRILFGNSRPFFGLVGVSLASSFSSILTKDEELEGVCCEIRSAVEKIQWFPTVVEMIETNVNGAVTLDQLELGKVVGQGTNGVVYAARLKADRKPSEHIDKDMDNSNKKEEIRTHPFALKMMFNYDIQSNSLAILRGMFRETVPAMCYQSHTNDWEYDLAAENRYLLPTHPNIVQIFAAFTDYIRHFDMCDILYPAALPRRLNPEGEGRNMSLFLLMRRYGTNLQEYLRNTQVTLRTSILLFAQLLEGVTHMNAHGVAHRDLKSDNLLLDVGDEEEEGEVERRVPLLVISDFGCCLADETYGLTVPYVAYDFDKGGNRALMPPEIVNQRPGIFQTLNYTKADLWTAATIAYELFGVENPFYRRCEPILNSATYTDEQLPELPASVPLVLRELISNLLQRNPKKRINCEIAANVLQLWLWAPSDWLKPSVKPPSSADILQWLLGLTTKVLYEDRGIFNSKLGQMRRSFPEFLLISTFLSRAIMYNIRVALKWMRDTVDLEEGY